MMLSTVIVIQQAHTCPQRHFIRSPQLLHYPCYASWLLGTQVPPAKLPTLNSQVCQALGDSGEQLVQMPCQHG